MADLIGCVRYSPKFPLTEQRAALIGHGVPADKIYNLGGEHTIENVIKARRRNSTVVVLGVSRLAESWPKMLVALRKLANAKLPLLDLRTGRRVDPGPAESLTIARSDYSSENRTLDPEEASRRGKLGGRKKTKLEKKHQIMWRDVVKYPTNDDAAAAVSRDLRRPVSVPTLRRKFGNSGRLAGWPVRDSKE